MSNQTLENVPDVETPPETVDPALASSVTNNTKLDTENEPSDTGQLDEAVDPADAQEYVEEVVDPCPKCGVGRHPDFPMCRACGYYEKLDTFVEVDEDDPHSDPFAKSPEKGVPQWAIILIVISVLVIVESFVAAFTLQLNSVPRMVWSLVQLGIGTILVLVAHGRATFMTLMNDSDSEIGDCVIRPTRIWAPVAAELPKTLPWVAMMTSGMMAILMSVMIIRSIPYNKLFETDAPPLKQRRSLVKAISNRAQGGVGNGNGRGDE